MPVNQAITLCTLKPDADLYMRLNLPLNQPLTIMHSSQLHLILSLECITFNNRPRSIYQYSNMAPRLSGQTSIFGVVFFVSKSLLGIEGQKKLEKFAILTRKPRSHA